MKICPRCQRTYTDDNLNFCLDDGVVLQKAAGGESPETVFMNPTPTTSGAGSQTTQPSTPAWNTAPQQFNQPPKKSKTWLWVLLVLALVVGLCGGGGIIGLVILGSMADSNTNTAQNTTKNKSGNVVVQNSPKAPPSNETKTTGEVQDIDMSEWDPKDSDQAYQSYTGGEYFLQTKQKRYYYVILAKQYTVDAGTIKVTVRNVDGSDSSLGYGLVFGSSIIPLISDYAFLIDTQKKRYRLVRHSVQTENPVVNWTNSDAINGGSQDNILEVRTQPGTISLYINGQMVKTVSNETASGVPGIYAGDATKAGFKNLEIIK